MCMGVSVAGEPGRGVSGADRSGLGSFEFQNKPLLPLNSFLSLLLQEVGARHLLFS